MDMGVLGGKQMELVPDVKPCHNSITSLLEKHSTNAKNEEGNDG
jgi:hypothetical protein